MPDYTPYVYTGKTMLIEQFLLLCEEECGPDDYDIFDLSMSSITRERLDNLTKSNYQNFPIHSEQNQENLNIFSSSSVSDHKKVVLCACIYSKTKTKILIQTLCCRGAKLFLNGKCFCNIQGDWSGQYYNTAILNKGANYLVLEQFAPQSNYSFFIQLRNYRFEMSDDIHALSNLMDTIEIDKPLFIHDPLFNTTAVTFRFMYFINEFCHYRVDYPIDIHDRSTNFVKYLNGKINQPIEIDVAELRNLHEDTLRHEWINSTIENPIGITRVFTDCLFLTDFSAPSKVICQKACNYANEMDSQLYNDIHGRINRIQRDEQTGDRIDQYWTTWQLKEILHSIESGTYNEIAYKTVSGMHEFYIHSDLDDSLIFMRSRIPPNYEPDKPYPVLLGLSTTYESAYSYYPHEQILDEPCLCFDVTGRGFTGGSYIGEASTMEVIQCIKTNFRIDEERIYLFGQSNGGFATYSIAQNHPGFAAAIFPHIGYPCMDTVENLSNTPVYQTVSPKDHVYKGRENDVKRALNSYGNYVQYDFVDMTHHCFSHYICHKPILNNLLKHRRERYPQTVIYKTYRNRHLKSFWIKINGIRKGSHYARIRAHIENAQSIRIRLQGSDSVTVQIPPQIDRRHFTIMINEKRFTLQEYKQPSIVLKKFKTWQIVDREPPIDYRKGSGLLDVYLNKMRIIIPEIENDLITFTAQNFSHPSTSGVDPTVYVNYPIYKDTDVPLGIFSNNLILLDINQQNKIVQRIKNHLFINYHADGFHYEQDEYLGDYEIIQVIANPYNPQFSILIVSTNKEHLLKSVLFTRKLCIPYYMNGFQPFLNNEVLIFYKNKYFGIYEPHGKLIEIN